MVHFFADGRSVRGCLRSRSHPWKSPRTGSQSEAMSAGSRAKVSTFCRRVAPVAAKRSSGAARRQRGSGCESPSGRRAARPRRRLQPQGRAGEYRVAVVHKAGEERRFGTTPATATPLPSSWKARDPVRPSKARPHRVRARRKRPEGRGSHREACVCRRPGAQISRLCGRAERPKDAEPSVEKPEDGSRSDVCRDRAKQSDFSRRVAPVTAKRASADGLTWLFVAMVIIKRTRPETTRHLFAG